MRNNVIEIWQPKYMTDTCLIAAYKVKEDNIIKFTSNFLIGCLMKASRGLREEVPALFFKIFEALFLSAFQRH